MANLVSQPKRQREEENIILENEDFQDSKRHKTFNQIISGFEEDVQEEFNLENFSEIFTILQEEGYDFNKMVASPDSYQEQKASAFDCSQDRLPLSKTLNVTQSSKDYELEEDDEGYDNVMKHLLEASDDELGLPNIEGNGDTEISGRDFPFPLNSGWWEFEDESANYYAILQSEFFL